MKTKLRFANQFTLDAGASGASANFVMSANGMFDPEGTAGGHQPRGFDEYMAMWAQFGVTEARITCWFAADSTHTDASIVGVLVSDQVGVTTNVIANMEHYDVQSAVLSQAGTGDPVKVVKTVHILDFLGRDGDIADDSDLLGNSSADPADGVFFTVFAAPVDPAVDNNVINCICFIDYVVDFFQHQRPPASDA